MPQRIEAEELLDACGAAHGCRAPMQYPFVGYDGHYYLCSSDWEKQVSCGTVFDASILEIVPRKYEHVTSRDPICRRCSNDAVNRLIVVLAARDAGTATEGDVKACVDDLDGQARDLRFTTAMVEAYLEGRRMPRDPAPRVKLPKDLIPLEVR